jgi:hypothetical protein
MTDPQLVAAIAAVGVLIAAIVGAGGSIIAARIGKKNHAAIQEVHLSLNSRLDELLKAAHFRGQVEERDNQRAVEQKAADHVDAMAAGQIAERDEQRAKQNPADAL